jgi:hypothetical protein
LPSFWLLSLASFLVFPIITGEIERVQLAEGKRWARCDEVQRRSTHGSPP